MKMRGCDTRAAQFTLGAMALRGQAGPKDQGSGAGWLQAAAGIGSDDAYRHGKAWRGDLLASP